MNRFGKRNNNQKLILEIYTERSRGSSNTLWKALVRADRCGLTMCVDARVGECNSTTTKSGNFNE